MILSNERLGEPPSIQPNGDAALLVRQSRPVSVGAPRLARSDWTRDLTGAAGLLLVMLVVYNANGREIGSYDTQGTKFAAIELLLRGTLSLNHVVGATPPYAERWGFIHTADGRYRSIYSPIPSLMAAAVTYPLWKMRIIDIRAPLAPAFLAKFTASLLVSLAVVLAFLTARRQLSRGKAALLAIGLGLGTGYWNSASQTLWQTETAVFGLALSVMTFVAPPERFDRLAAVLAGFGLGLAGAARPQLAPIVAVLLAGIWKRGSKQNAAIATIIVAAFATSLCIVNLRWYGHPLGALPLIEGLNATVHDTGRSFTLGLEGLAGLLVSPNRGLLIFSPVVLVALAGVRAAVRKGWDSALFWCGIALGAQYALYGSYSVWWGGHTYGPRYMLDVLPLFVPFAAEAMAWPSPRKIVTLAAASALVWSVIVAATGAFYYPNDLWNLDPADVDRHHARLWSWRDNQIARCWQRGPSPQNFALFDPLAVRRSDTDRK